MHLLKENTLLVFIRATSLIINFLIVYLITYFYSLDEYGGYVVEMALFMLLSSPFTGSIPRLVIKYQNYKSFLMLLSIFIFFCLLVYAVTLNTTLFILLIVIVLTSFFCSLFRAANKVYIVEFFDNILSPSFFIIALLIFHKSFNPFELFMYASVLVLLILSIVYFFSKLKTDVVTRRLKIREIFSVSTNSFLKKTETELIYLLLNGVVSNEIIGSIKVAERISKISLLLKNITNIRYFKILNEEIVVKKKAKLVGSITLPITRAVTYFYLSVSLAALFLSDFFLNGILQMGLIDLSWFIFFFLFANLSYAIRGPVEVVILLINKDLVTLIVNAIKLALVYVIFSYLSSEQFIFITFTAYALFLNLVGIILSQYLKRKGFRDIGLV